MAKQVAVVLASIALLFEHADMDTSWDVRAPLLRLSVAAGESASLICRSPPPGNISWFREYANSFPTEIKNTKRTTTDSKGTLHFSYVQRNDTGGFKCGVSEVSLVTFGSKVNMTVLTSTDKSMDAKPKVMFHSGAIKGELGEDIKLECIFSGRPLPNISWRHSNVVLESAGRVLVSHSSVVITNVTEADRGIYTCTGENASGTAAATVTVDVPQTDRSAR
ncbi:contactin-5-like isoform X2 [Haliotis rubra]|uniref:contactin-5-like isoform X2 n=1 Tax=Haliotis rubra TaxID=36100 RepID=UPI001EE61532|nr:contactin-5-like isoform X2 [Haliotis rubra]